MMIVKKLPTAHQWLFLRTIIIKLEKQMTLSAMVKNQIVSKLGVVFWRNKKRYYRRQKKIIFKPFSMTDVIRIFEERKVAKRWIFIAFFFSYHDFLIEFFLLDLLLVFYFLKSKWEINCLWKSLMQEATFLFLPSMF